MGALVYARASVIQLGRTPHRSSTGLTLSPQSPSKDAYSRLSRHSAVVEDRHLHVSLKPPQNAADQKACPEGPRRSRRLGVPMPSRDWHFRGVRALLIAGPSLPLDERVSYMSFIGGLTRSLSRSFNVHTRRWWGSG